MNTISYTVESKNGGAQLRAYGPHIWDGYLTFSVPEGQMFASKFGHTEDVAKKYLAMLVTSFDVITGDGMTDYFSPKLKTLKQVSPGRWHYIIESPYID